jgi:hypothetical protein
MEQRMKVASVVGLARTLAAWTILSALVFTFGFRSLTDFHELQLEDQLAAEFCRQVPQ